MIMFLRMSTLLSLPVLREGFALQEFMNINPMTMER